MAQACGDFLGPLWVGSMTNWLNRSKFNGTSAPKGSYSAKTGESTRKHLLSGHSAKQCQAKSEQNVRQDLIPRVGHGEAALMHTLSWVKWPFHQICIGLLWNDLGLVAGPQGQTGCPAARCGTTSTITATTRHSIPTSSPRGGGKPRVGWKFQCKLLHCSLW